MKQVTFAAAKGFEVHGRATRKAQFLARMEELAGVPIDIVSTGADRVHTIVLRHPYD